ncbi:NUDIX domain-containing protein [Ornithinimicrobium sp. Y1694]|uniref:NUDIX domain-containing protein n=1 Tax=Ornithinimicrobium sp. Y1694 TaxID=3418590 RepID=UPI003CE8500F
MDLRTLRRKASTAALLAFRLTPEPIKRRVVRVVAPTYVAGAVCVLEHDGEVLMLWQPHRAGWSLPGGFMDRGEDPAHCVQREVAEEVGLDIDPGDPITALVDPERQGLHVIFRVELAERPDLEVASEARKARWVAAGETVEADDSTRKILAAWADLRRPRRPGVLRSDAS